MRLLIKQRVFSWSDTYDVYDEFENVRYFVKGEVFSLGHCLHVYNAYQMEVGRIREKLLTFLPAFENGCTGETPTCWISCARRTNWRDCCWLSP